MRKRSVALAAAAVSILLMPQALVPQAQAFGTIRSLGQNAEHERITRQGLASFGFGSDAERARRQERHLGRGGRARQPDARPDGSKAAHCDGGDFFAPGAYPQSAATAQSILTSCRTYIYNNINAAVTDAARLVKPNGSWTAPASSAAAPINGTKGRAKCNVFEDMGMAFHAAQDFYSHSNWIDTPRASPSIANPQGLNHTAPAPWLSAGGAGFPGGLISGCYDGFPESLYCGGRIKHATLNKDTAGSTRGAGGRPIPAP
jgi:hypothetical protein